MTQTFTRVYDSYAQAQDVVLALKNSGIAEQEISLVANNGEEAIVETIAPETSNAGTGAEIGTAIGGSVGLLAGLGIMAIPGIGPVVAAGWLAATAVGAVAGAVAGGATGGIVDALKGNGMSEDDAHVYAESVRRGGTLVTVRVPDERDAEVTRILSQYPAVNPLIRGAEYRAAGWQKFDPAATPYVRADHVTSLPVSAVRPDIR